MWWCSFIMKKFAIYSEKLYYYFFFCARIWRAQLSTCFCPKWRNRLFTNHLLNTKHMVRCREDHIFSYFKIWRVTASIVIRYPQGNYNFFLQLMVYLGKRDTLAALTLLLATTEMDRGAWNSSFLSYLEEIQACCDHGDIFISLRAQEVHMV